MQMYQQPTRKSTMIREKSDDLLRLKRGAYKWIETVTGKTLTDPRLGQGFVDLIALLVDGEQLCRVMQAISPKLIPRIKTKRATTTTAVIFRSNENLSFFLQACEEVGLPRHKRFAIHDITTITPNLVNIKRVLDCIYTLCKIANEDPKYEFNVPWPNIDFIAEPPTNEESREIEMLILSKDPSAHKEPTPPKELPVEKPAESEASSSQPIEPIVQKALITDKEKAAIKIQSAARGWFARIKYRKLVRGYAYREHVAQEILSTEKTYISSLTWVKNNVLTPLRNAIDSHTPIIEDNELRVIFSNLEIILSYNQILLEQLESRVGNWTPHQLLGDIFLQIASYLKIYSQYCSNYNDALKTLLDCKKQPKFAKFLDDLKKKNESLLLTGLEDYLIRPVQRIPRYNLLLLDLVKHTTPDHPDYANLANAEKKVKSVAEHMNEKKREFENIMKVTEIQETIEGNSEPLARPHRRFVLEGEFYELPLPVEGKKSGTFKKLELLKPLCVFLFNDIFLVTSKTSSGGFLGKSRSLKKDFYQQYKLLKIRVMSLDETYTGPNLHGLALTTVTRRAPLLHLATTDPKVRDQWIQALEDEINGATMQYKEHEDRVTNTAKDRVEDAKLQLEKQFKNARIRSLSTGTMLPLDIVGAGGDTPNTPNTPNTPSPGSVTPNTFFSSNESGDSEASSPPPSPLMLSVDLLSSPDSSSGDQPKMSLREKRLAMQKEAIGHTHSRKHSSTNSHDGSNGGSASSSPSISNRKSGSESSEKEGKKSSFSSFFGGKVKSSTLKL
eukprot:TRINITY_DN234_c0_g3_i1.p1 TRINITY_DN234_c0_g3~~TRINITY_DN234_c0_g3_i1.p1  ORF type:complete len:784 (+),score=187.98 TRINITY_DN234_c0_g3_i1:333-2684(+)